MTEPNSLLNASNENINYLHHAKQWEGSGMNQVTYCHSHGINYFRFVHTRSKLRDANVKTNNAKPKKKFIPVRISSEPVESTNFSKSMNKNNIFILRFPKGGSLEVPIDLNQPQLSQLFKALETIL